MRWHDSKRRVAATIATIVTLYLLGITSAIAHGGHQHATGESGGFDVTVVYQVAGTAMAVVIASRVYRWRDARREDRDP